MSSPGSRSPSPALEPYGESDDLGEDLAWADNLPVFADANPDLAPPDKEPDSWLAFRAEHARSFSDETLGRRIAQRRALNVKLQTERCQDPQFLQLAEDEYQRIKLVFEEELEAADRALGPDFHTHHKTHWDASVLTHPLLVRGFYPPDRTDAALGFDDTSIPTLRMLEKLGILEARKRGQVALLDLHDDDKHSASTKHHTFPIARNGRVSWGSCGCSARHHAAFVRRDNAIESFRTKFVLGETLNFGYGIVKPWHDAFLAADNGLKVTIPRDFHSIPKYEELAPPWMADVTLHWAQPLSSSPAPTPNDLERRLVDHVPSFTYLSQSTSHVSLGMYAPKDQALSRLARIHATDRAINEVAFLAGVEVEKDNLWVLSRLYIAKSRAADTGFFIPMPVAWAYVQLTKNRDARTWTSDEAQPRLGASFTDTLNQYAASWSASGRHSIGKSVGVVGFLESAIAGWKLSLIASVKRTPFPLLQDKPSRIIGLLAPATTADGRTAAVTHLLYNAVGLDEPCYPALSDDPDRIVGLVAPATTGDGRTPALNQSIHGIAIRNRVGWPSLPAELCRRVGLVAPATTGDGRSAAFVHLDRVTADNAIRAYPCLSERPGGIVGLMAPATSGDGRSPVLDTMAHSKEVERRRVYPFAPKNQILLAPACTGDGRSAFASAGQRNQFGARNRDGVLTEQRLLDDDDDLEDVGVVEVIRYFREKNWSKRNGPLAESKITLVRRPVPLLLL
ncbi:uncharacterized protein RHOBADRAFT_54538 [Rhodotorula graminis WP1]|uniref:Uncharacterized protein n=1 Tax=Rhodotorula graminis (strain WP1) TaxID=578459 RepID=A0A0P9H1S5_RHOGW|nr:uncharacterized protein RHOBADRAFT_54538 [Rhodotorula graminis WP1]KPV73955.1 hypothetical protein RHOBADRAFT_54538 [Rhodotorula graminis WP1]